MVVEEVNADLKVFNDADIREKIFNYVMCDKLTKKQFYDLIDMMKDILDQKDLDYEDLYDQYQEEVSDLNAEFEDFEGE